MYFASDFQLSNIMLSPTELKLDHFDLLHFLLNTFQDFCFHICGDFKQQPGVWGLKDKQNLFLKVW